MEWEGTLWDGLNHISRIELKLFKLGLAHQSLWHWNVGFHKDQYLDLFYLPCTPLHLVISSVIIVWVFHLCADDTQQYIHVSFKPYDSTFRQTAISQVEACIKDIKTWMINNLLQLNDDKTELTELIIITTSETTSHQEEISFNIGDSSVGLSTEPSRSLGVLFDSTCCLNYHVKKICQNINYRKYLDKLTTEKNDKFGSDIPFGLLQKHSVWYQWIFSASATTLLE